MIRLALHGGAGDLAPGSEAQPLHRAELRRIADIGRHLLRDGALRQLTDDHSWTAELVRQGELTEREAVNHPHRGVLTRALGAGPKVHVDGALHTVVAGDRFLLCTDGLFNDVADSDILSLMQGAIDVGVVADALVERALSNGARDNVGVVVADVRT